MTQAQAPPPTNTSGRQMSPSSSVSTITTDQVMKQSIHITHKQDHYSTTNLSTIESSSTNASFVTPAASLAMPLSRTLSNPLSLQNMSLDNDSDEENDSLKKSDDDLSERLAKLQTQDLAAFLPISSNKNSTININDNSLENNESVSFRTPVIDLTANLQQQPITKGLSKKNLKSFH